MRKSEFVKQSTEAAMRFEALAMEITCPVQQERLRAAARKVRFRARLAAWGIPVRFLDPFKKPKPFDPKLLSQLKVTLTAFKAGQVSNEQVRAEVANLIGLAQVEDIDDDLSELSDTLLQQFARAEIDLRLAANSFASIIESDRQDRAALARRQQELRLCNCDQRL